MDRQTADKMLDRVESVYQEFVSSEGLHLADTPERWCFDDPTSILTWMPSEDSAVYYSIHTTVVEVMDEPRVYVEGNAWREGSHSVNQYHQPVGLLPMEDENIHRLVNDAYDAVKDINAVDLEY